MATLRSTVDTSLRLQGGDSTIRDVMQSFGRQYRDLVDEKGNWSKRTNRNNIRRQKKFHCFYNLGFHIPNMFVLLLMTSTKPTFNLRRMRILWSDKRSDGVRGSIVADPTSDVLDWVAGKEGTETCCGHVNSWHHCPGRFWWSVRLNKLHDDEAAESAINYLTKVLLRMFSFIPNSSNHEHLSSQLRRFINSAHVSLHYDIVK